MIGSLPRRAGNQLCFSDIINKRFIPEDPNGYENETNSRLRVGDLPISKGSFGAKVSRVEWIKIGAETIRLPYVDDYESKSRPQRDKKIPRRRGGTTQQSAADSISPGTVRRSGSGKPASSTPKNAGNRTGESSRVPAAGTPKPTSKMNTNSPLRSQKAPAQVKNEASKTQRTGKAAQRRLGQDPN